MSGFSVKRLCSSFALPILLLVIGCGHYVRPSIAQATAGSYQLDQYSTANLSDNNPTGTIQVTEISPDLINITVMGTSGKTKFTYTYSNVDVVLTGQNAFDQDMFSLIYKGKYLGQAGSDGISRFIEIYPTPRITLRAIEY
ncbi:hypothetical protein [Spirosoma aerolatum]|uniref:hypothetical protein n=1 Tax=Spirosoma aerolatum TaxID=1211326 RepID=UPI0009AD1817|nr:hypothetical protein [Spirosoma aerolatum]